MCGKFVVQCNHLSPTVHPPYVLVRTYCVFTVLGQYSSIYVGYYFFLTQMWRNLIILITLFCMLWFALWIVVWYCYHILRLKLYCVFTALGLYLSIYVGYYFYFISNVKKFDDFDTFICYAMVCLVNSCVILLSYSEAQALFCFY